LLVLLDKVQDSGINSTQRNYKWITKSTQTKMAVEWRHWRIDWL